MHTQFIQIDDDIISYITKNLYHYFHGAGISHDSATTLCNICQDRLENDGKDAFISTIRHCSEELGLKLHLLIDDAINYSKQFEELEEKKLTEEDIILLQDYI